MAGCLSLRARIIIVLLLILLLSGLSLAELDRLALVRGGLFCVFLLAMAVIDFRTGLLPDRGNLYLAALGLVMAWLLGEVQDALLGALLGAALLFALRTLSRGGIGLGDVKYASAFGIWLGWQGTLLALVLAFAIGACLALVLLGTGRLGRRDRLAFGPFLSAGAYLSYIGGTAFWSAYEVLL
jgi:leader peptidase (prepilin peptidase)/N-methyltransferase|nr:A24 family peptidase [Mitsuokella multacida]